MADQQRNDSETVLAFTSAAATVERIIDGNLSAIKGISLAEFRLLSAIADAPAMRASRADIARTIGLSPSAVTRALRPLESLGMVRTVKNERDARLALATLTPDGESLLADAIGVVDDIVPTILERSPSLAKCSGEFQQMLTELTHL